MDAVAAKQRADLRAREPPIAGEGVDEQGVRPHERARVEAEPAVHHLVASADARSRELDEPADVLGRHEVPRVAEDVRAQDLAAREGLVDRGLGEPAAPLADGPSRDGVLLCLHGAEVPDDVGCAPGRGACEALVDQPSPGELQS